MVGWQQGSALCGSSASGCGECNGPTAPTWLPGLGSGSRSAKAWRARRRPPTSDVHDEAVGAGRHVHPPPAQEQLQAGLLVGEQQRDATKVGVGAGADVAGRVLGAAGTEA